MNEVYRKHSTSGTGNESDEAVPTGEEREALREELLGVNAQNMLEFQNRATRKFGPSAGPFIRQIIFWDGNRSAAGEGWMWKSRREMCEETGLNQKPQEKARKVLKAAGVLEEELRPVGPMKRQTLHYRANLNRLLGLLFPPVSGTGNPKRDHVPESLKGTQNRNRPGGSALQESSSVEHLQESTSVGDASGKKAKAGAGRGPGATSPPSSHEPFDPDDYDPEIDFLYGDPDNDFILDAESRARRDAAATSSLGAKRDPERNRGSEGRTEDGCGVYVASSMGDALVQAIAETDDDGKRRSFEKLLGQWQRAQEKESHTEAANLIEDF